jgi:sugar transferase EpsL
MIKRLLDFILAFLLILVLSPMLLIVGLAVWLFLGSPIIFRHERPGRNGAIFNLYKFRSMSNQRDADGELLPDEQRLSRFGGLLRSTSLDELPSLVNVLKGDMSFVGPRPLLVEYLPLYNSRQARRHEVRPGITGWAQVNGRNAISWDDKLEFDVWYVDNQSPWLDLRIFVMTLKSVLLRAGISQPDHPTMKKFTGSR